MRQNNSNTLKEEFSNSLSSYQSVNRGRSNSKEKSIKVNDSFDVDYESHIVLRNTSSNIFRYSNYNKNIDENQHSTMYRIYYTVFSTKTSTNKCPKYTTITIRSKTSSSNRNSPLIKNYSIRTRS